MFPCFLCVPAQISVLIVGAAYFLWLHSYSALHPLDSLVSSRVSFLDQNWKEPKTFPQVNGTKAKWDLPNRALQERICPLFSSETV